MARNKKSFLDKFYTKKEVVINLLSKLKLNDFDLVIEPSAGDGSFYTELIGKCKKLIAIDIEPEHNDIIKQNWLDFQYDKEYYKVLIIGNPPFGNQSKLIFQFFNKCNELKSSTIAFILPKSFKKDSIKNKIPNYYHLIYEEELNDNSFILENKDYSVPSIFQIWERKYEIREKIKMPTKTIYFDFVKKSENPELTFRRVGFYAGRVFDNIDKCEQSHYFIKSNKNLNINILRELLMSINWNHNNTAGPKSIGKSEIIIELEKLLH